MSDPSSSPRPAGSPGGPGRGRYIVGANDPADLLAVAARASTGDVAVRRTIGSGPDLLVVEASPAFMESLRTEYAGRLVIEADQELPHPGPVLPPGVA